MLLTWDPPKRLANLDKHGFDFEDTYEFDCASAVVTDARPDRLGRPRSKAIAFFRGQITVMSGREGVAIISFRRAKLRERLLVHGKR